MAGDLDIEKLFAEIVPIEGGEFQMGDKYSSHLVRLDRFGISQYPLTQTHWEAMMVHNPSAFKGPELPVVNVSWYDCQRFIEKLNAKTGYDFRLPTEAEWEYAAGGGVANRTLWAGTNDKHQLVDFAWLKTDSNSQTHPVGQKNPNALGLYDMSGNVWEWCQDWYGDYPEGSHTNPQGPEIGEGRVIRGGGWISFPRVAMVTYRSSHLPDRQGSSLGFRLALSL
ncbi:MAG: formylglycine-generating enzyme family protein [Bacteroidota bacterium]